MIEDILTRFDCTCHVEWESLEVQSPLECRRRVKTVDLKTWGVRETKVKTAAMMNINLKMEHDKDIGMILMSNPPRFTCSFHADPSALSVSGCPEGHVRACSHAFRFMVL